MRPKHHLPEPTLNIEALKLLYQWAQEDMEQQHSLAEEQSQDAPTVTNLAGGMQSQVLRDYTLIPPDALANVARVMYNGAQKYAKDNWRLISCDDHLNHALNHIYLYLAGNTNEDHLAHATTRMMMALELQEDPHDS